MRPRSIGWGVAFWLTICAALAVVVAWQLATSFPLAPTVTAAPPSRPVLDFAERHPLPRSPDAGTVDAIAARPLFSESRRPYVPPAEATGAAPQPSGPSLPLELAGTYLTEADQAALLLVSGKTPEWLREGQLIAGWRIEAIEQDRVRLRKDGRDQVLQLRDDTAVAGPARAERPQIPSRQSDDHDSESQD